jgi:VRR-NUC domain
LAITVLSTARTSACPLLSPTKSNETPVVPPVAQRRRQLLSKTDGGSFVPAQLSPSAPNGERPLKEAELQKAVIAMARQFHWRVYHTLPARVKGDRWVTPTQGDAGFPDLVLVRDTRCMAVELKADKGVMRQTQVEWINALAAASIEVDVWKPADWHSGRIEMRLR